MSPTSLALTNGRIIGEISLDPTKNAGEGGLTDACLVFPLQIRLNPSSSKGVMITLTKLTYSLHSHEPTPEQNQLGLSARINVMVGFSCRSTTHGPSNGFTYVRLLMSAALITRLENQHLRYLEHAVSVQLHLQPTLAWMEQTRNVTPDEYEEHPFKGEQTGPFSRLSYFWYTQAGDLAAQILCPKVLKTGSLCVDLLNGSSLGASQFLKPFRIASRHIEQEREVSLASI